jgi:hypothetical protein
MVADEVDLIQNPWIEDTATRLKHDLPGAVDLRSNRLDTARWAAGFELVKDATKKVH